MEKLVPNKLNLASINNGYKYVNGDSVTASDLNKLIEGVADAQKPTPVIREGVAKSPSQGKKTVLWEGELKDITLKSYFNSSESYYPLPINNLPETISEDACLIFKMQLGGEMEFNIVKPLITAIESDAEIGDMVAWMIAQNSSNIIYGSLGAENMSGQSGLSEALDMGTKFMLPKEIAGVAFGNAEDCIIFEPIQVGAQQKSGSMFKTEFLCIANNIQKNISPINPYNENCDSDAVLKKITLVER